MLQKILAATGFLLLAGCGNYTQLKNGGDADRPVDLSVQNLNFAAVNQSIFATRCLECHQQYSTYAGVKREVDTIEALVESDQMPKSGAPLSANQKLLLKMWIAAGSPETSGVAPSTPVAAVVLLPNYASLAANLISPKCLACHNPQGLAKFLDLSSRASIFAKRDKTFADKKKLIDFDHPEESYLLEVVNDPDEPMPPPYSKIPRLTTTEVQALKDWITQGLP